MAKRSDPWFKFYPRDWLEDTRQLTLEQRGAYIDAIAIQMMTEKPLVDDYEWLGHQLHISGRKAKTLVEQLITLTMLKRTPAGIVNERCNKEIAEKEVVRRINAEIAAKREADRKRGSGPNQRRLDDGSATNRSPAGHEPTSKGARPNAENPKKTNGNSVTSAISCHEAGTTRARTDTDTDTERKKDYSLLPPSVPEGGSTPEVVSETKKRRDRHALTAAEHNLAMEGITVYNEVAEALRFVPCRTPTPSRLLRLCRRIEDIGGIDNLRRALWAARQDDFLMGRIKRPGHASFRLNIDLLMQTNSNMGDVLARLLDSAGGKAPAAELTPNWWQSKEHRARELGSDWWQSVIGKFANGRWPVEYLGPGPWDANCLVPVELVTELSLKAKYPTADGVCATR
jgi:uncharacterized protein YdaU (DUF1376 family)